MIRLLFSLFMLAFMAGGGWWVWETQPVVRQLVQAYIPTQDFVTLEVRFTPEQIMEQNSKELLKDDQHTFLDPVTSFYPHVLMEVKYIKDNNGSTGEGMILWDLVDGEMVIATSTWDKTHGYEDCINSNADRNDFKVINALAKGGNALDREGLLSALQIESDTMDGWIESTKAKEIVVQKGNKYRIHLQNPKFIQFPETKLSHNLVSKAYKLGIKVTKKYSVSQVIRVAKAAFGAGFAVRSFSEVYLPVYTISIQNPDGSLFTTQWNALTGKRIQKWTP